MVILIILIMAAVIVGYVINRAFEAGRRTIESGFVAAEKTASFIARKHKEHEEREFAANLEDKITANKRKPENPAVDFSKL